MCLCVVVEVPTSILWGLLLGLKRSLVVGGGDSLLIGWVREMRNEIKENEWRGHEKGEGNLTGEIHCPV